MNTNNKTTGNPETRKPGKNDSVSSLKHLIAVLSSVGVALLSLSTSTYALHIKPDHVGDPLFSAGPCPVSHPLDGAPCPGGAATCPAFYNPNLLPAGYNSVAYCNYVMGYLGFGLDNTTVNFFTRALNPAEQAAWIKAAQRVESYVKDDVTVVFEPYEFGSIFVSSSAIGIVFGATEFFTPLCASDLALPPYAPAGTPQDAQNHPTYDQMIRALKHKNAKNKYPFALTKYLPSRDKINMEWSSTFNPTFADSNIDAYNSDNFLVNSFLNLFPTSPLPTGPAPGTKPLTICASPANIKALHLEHLFDGENFKFADYNAPEHNHWVTQRGTDGADVMAPFPNEFTSNLPYQAVPQDLPYYVWMLDPSDPAVQNRQLPVAYYTHHNQVAQFFDACDDPVKCTWPKGFQYSNDFQATNEHEIRHLMGVMWSEYYKQPQEGNGMAVSYNNALFLMDLFILDADEVAKQQGNPFTNPSGKLLLKNGSDWAKAHRNMDSNEPIQNIYYTDLSTLTPWIDFGHKDHVFVYLDKKGKFQYFPLMNYSIFNPDGDTKLDYVVHLTGYNPDTNTATFVSDILQDPIDLKVKPTDIFPNQVMAGGNWGLVGVDTEREFATLSALGWDVDPSGYVPPIKWGTAPTARWYKKCFDKNGVFHASHKCKCSVLPEDLKRVDDDESSHH